MQPPRIGHDHAKRPVTFREIRSYKYREITARLKEFGFVFHRQVAGSHEIWFRPESNRYTTIPNHPGDMPEGTLRAILKQADIDPQDFIEK